MNHSLSRFLVVAAAVSTLSAACTNRLKDYTQVTMQAKVSANNPELNQEDLATTKTILENRLAGLGIELAEVETIAPDQIVVRLPQTFNIDVIEPILASTGQLILKNQKPDTEEALATKIETLQRLLVEQNTLEQTQQTEQTQQIKEAEKIDRAIALRTEIEQTRAAIAALFEPSDLTGEMLVEAKAMPAEDGNTWNVKLWFNSEGAAMFAEQTEMMAGTGRTIGFFLDDVLLSAPVVDIAFAESGITGGEAIISGNFTNQAAKYLEIQLTNGALPVNLNTLEIVSSDQPQPAAADEAAESAADETADSAAEQKK